MMLALDSGPIRVATVEDHFIFLAGLRSALGAQSTLELVGEARNAREAWRVACCKRPRVMLMDVNLGGGPNGIALTQALSKYYPAIAVLVLSVSDGIGYQQSAYRAGAQGYITKVDPPDRVVRAIHVVAQGGTFWPAGFVKDPGPVLTKAELKVARILARGLHNRDVARLLGITARTVETHRYNIRQRLEVDGVIEIYEWLRERGLLDGDLDDGPSIDDLGALLEAELQAELAASRESEDEQCEV